MQTSAEITQPAVKAILDFVFQATGVAQPTQLQVNNALLIVTQACEECRQAFSASAWHSKQQVHSFEALACRYAGANHRWPPVTLNLHYSERSDGTVVIATPEEMPVPKNYFVQRVLADARCSADGD